MIQYGTMSTWLDLGPSQLGLTQESID